MSSVVLPPLSAIGRHVDVDPHTDSIWQPGLLVQLSIESSQSGVGNPPGCALHDPPPDGAGGPLLELEHAGVNATPSAIVPASPKGAKTTIHPMRTFIEASSKKALPYHASPTRPRLEIGGRDRRGARAG
jgi:hypothetical protein